MGIGHDLEKLEEEVGRTYSPRLSSCPPIEHETRRSHHRVTSSQRRTRAAEAGIARRVTSLAAVAFGTAHHGAYTVPGTEEEDVEGGSGRHGSHFRTQPHTSEFDENRVTEALFADLESE
uniref:Uncharacterized protein n=1 Tax=Octactis speculum TaxID=3111310 RepID=A0A7S2B792_9STRA